MRWFLGLALLITLPAAAAESCGFVDLRERLGPPLHQGDSGYCFAHSASTLIEARLGVRISPMQLATGYLLTNADELTGAMSSSVTDRLTPAFYHQWHSDRAQEPGNYAPDKILTAEGLLNTGGDELQTLVVANYLGLCDESRLPTGDGVYKKYLKNIQAFHARRLEHGIPPDERNRPIGEVADPEARAKAWSFRHWVENRCGVNWLPRSPLAPTEISLAPNLKAFRRLQRTVSFTAGQSRIMDVVNAQLDRGNPIAIGYALSDIMPGEASVQSVQTGQPVPADVDHASVFAGRRLVNGKCYYYLRNSFGDTEEGYVPALKGRLEQGGAWVLPEEIPSMYSAVWLE
jgi:hypothetical protein